MKSAFCVFVFCIWGISASAQPGYAYRLQGNLNEIDSFALQKCGEPDGLCQPGEIVIDATTDLSRVIHLKNATALILEIKLPAIPEEFKDITFNNLTQLVIYCDSSVSDLSNLRNMPSLQNLIISEYAGETLNADFSTFSSLNSITLYSAFRLKNLEAISYQCPVSSISLFGCAELHYLFRPSSVLNKQLMHLRLQQVSPQFDLTTIKNMKHLEWLWLSGFNFSAIPDYLPETLTALYVGFNQSLKNIDQLQQMSNLKMIRLEGNAHLEDWNQNWE